MTALDLAPLNLLGGTYDWIILLLVAVLLFGGTRLAGIGKGAGRAIREFKEETDSLRPANGQSGSTGATAATSTPQVESAPSLDQQAAADVLPQQNTQRNL